MEMAEEGFMQSAESIGAPYKDDGKLFVRFSMKVGTVKKPVLDKDGNPTISKWTDQYGEQHERPVVKAQRDNIEFIEIRVPGDKSLCVCEPVTEQHRRRFPEAYRRFKAGVTEVAGTPISAMFPNNPALVEDLKHQGVHTVEHLAGLSDGTAQGMGPVLKFREQAQRFIKAMKGTAKAELDAQRDAELEALKAKVAELMAEKGDAEPSEAQSSEPAPKRRGRPPKAQPVEG